MQYLWHIINSVDHRALFSLADLSIHKNFWEWNVTREDPVVRTEDNRGEVTVWDVVRGQNLTLCSLLIMDGVVYT